MLITCSHAPQSEAIGHGLALGNGIRTVHYLEHALERPDGTCGSISFAAASAIASIYYQLSILKRVIL